MKPTILTDKNICAVNEKTLHAVANFAKSNQHKKVLHPIYVIVPDRSTLLCETFLTCHAGCLLNVRVLTFSMLYNVLHGGSDTPVLNKTMAVLYMWLSIKNVRAELKYFSKSVDQYAFAEKMFNTINQLTSCMADFTKLEQNSKTEITKRKMHDISLIWREYKKLTANYIDGSGILAWLIANISKSKQIAEAYVYITGFEHFSVQRGEVVRLLLKHAKSFVIGVQNKSEAEGFINEISFA